MRFYLIVGLFFIGNSTWADVVFPTSTIRANTVLTPDHVILKSYNSSHGIMDITSVIGMESRVVLYAGRPIRWEDLSAPALVSRNELVSLIFRKSGLSISTMGRALGRGAEGELIRVMNLTSRTTLFGRVLPNGNVDVSGN